jgi:hypothetical protein
MLTLVAHLQVLGPQIAAYDQWVRILSALWRAQQSYDASIFRAAQQTHARRAA